MALTSSIWECYLQRTHVRKRDLEFVEAMKKMVVTEIKTMDAGRVQRKGYERLTKE